MGKKSIQKNYIYNTCYQILLLITPLITTPYLSRVLGADGIGTVSYAESIVSYFVLFATMGISTFGQREISYVQDSSEKRSSVFWNTKLFTLFTAGIALFIYVIFACMSENILLYMIFSVNILAVLVDVTWFFQGMEEFQKIVIRNVIFKALNILYVFVFVQKKEDIYLYALGHCIFTLISNITLWGYLPKYVKKIERKELHPFKNTKIIIGLFVPTIAIQIYTVLDKTMIGVITQDAYENGYYEQALKIARMVLMLVASLGTVMIPRIGFHFQKGESNEVQRLMYRGYRFALLLGLPLCFGLILVADNMVPWFFGDGYDKVAVLLKIVSLIIVVIGLNNIGGMQYLIPTKREKQYTITVLLGAGTNFILNMCLIPSMGSVGAAIASVIAETVVLIAQFVIIRKEISVTRVIKEGRNYYLAVALMSVALYIEGKFLTSSIINTMLMIASGVFCYFTCLIIVKDEFFFSNVEKVLTKIKSKVR